MAFTNPTSQTPANSTDPKGNTSTDQAPARNDKNDKDAQSPQEALKAQEPRQSVDGQTSDGTQVNAFRSEVDDAVKKAHEAIDKLADAANKVVDKATN